MKKIAIVAVLSIVCGFAQASVKSSSEVFSKDGKTLVSTHTVHLKSGHKKAKAIKARKIRKEVRKRRVHRRMVNCN
jgi:hypothetical protein